MTIPFKLCLDHWHTREDMETAVTRIMTEAADAAPGLNPVQINFYRPSTTDYDCGINQLALDVIYTDQQLLGVRVAIAADELDRLQCIVLAYTISSGIKTLLDRKRAQRTSPLDNPRQSS